MSSLERKILTLEQAQQLRSSWPQPWVLTNGVFDILHRGHVSYLEAARDLGALLVVAVNDDISAQRLEKGCGRPFNALDDRMALLAALQSVGFVLPFSEDNAAQVVTLLRPSIYVKGGDYRISETAEGRAVDAYGGQCREISFRYQRSTTALVQRIQSYTKE